MAKIKTIILIQFLLLASCSNENNSFLNTSIHNESTSSENVCANNCITDLKGNVFSEDELIVNILLNINNTGFSSLADYISYSNI